MGRESRPHKLEASVDTTLFVQVENFAIHNHLAMAEALRELVKKGLENAETKYGLHHKYTLSQCKWFCAGTKDDKPINYFASWIRRRGFQAKVMDDVIYTELTADDMSKILKAPIVY